MNESFHDSFDDTVWDPTNPEQAIEDPVHGPEARLRLLSTPPYPNEDGTYHVFGGLYVCGTTSFDAEGRPFIRMGGASSMLRAIRDSHRHMEWIEKWKAGELPPFEEMGYPVFQLEAQPYLIIDNPALDSPLTSNE